LASHSEDSILTAHLLDMSLWDRPSFLQMIQHVHNKVMGSVVEPCWYCGVVLAVSGRRLDILVDIPKIQKEALQSLWSWGENSWWYHKN